MNILKQRKGITLIALIITIIVLLILAGVALSLILGENGIFGKANNAKEETLKSQGKEKIELAIADYEVSEEKYNLERADFNNIENNEISIEDPTDATEDIVDAICNGYRFGVKKNTNKVYCIGEASGPTITITSEQINAKGYAKEDVTLTVTAKSARSEIQSIKDKDGNELALTGNNGGKVATYTVTGKGGTYTFTATDGEGKTITKQKEVKIDRNAPTCEITSAQATDEGIQVTVSGDDAAADANNEKSEIEKYKFYVTKSGESQPTEYEKTKISNNVYEITGLSGGSYSIYAVAYDVAENNSNLTESINVTKTGLVDYWQLSSDLSNSVSNGAGALQVAKGSQPTYSDGSIYLNNTVLSTQNNYNFPSTFSICVDYKPTAINEWAGLVCKSVSMIDDRDGLWLWKDKLRLDAEFDTSNNIFISNTVLTLNNWNNIVGTYDGRNLKMYVNGVLLSTDGTSWRTCNIQSPLYIAGTQQSGEDAGAGTTAAYAPGYYKNIRIYYGALTQQEINNLN